MRAWRSRWELLVQDAAPAGLLNALNDAGVRFVCAEPLDAVTLRLEVAYEDIAAAREVLASRGSDLRICCPRGFRPRGWALLRRRVLLTAALCCFALLAASNLFVWRIEVSGVDETSVGTVLRAMENVGAGIGSFWPGIDGERVKNELLLELEGVQWVGISYHTGVIYVEVREQREIPGVVDHDDAVHITASRDGIITEITAKQGQCVVGVGDTVEQGQILISGAAKSPIGSTRAVHGIGTVRARTWQTLSAKQSATVTEKRYTGKTRKKIALKVAGKRINFSLGSSILRGTCDKIIMDYHLCMEDVFALPVALTVERTDEWEPVVRELSVEERVSRGKHILMETLKLQLGDEGRVVTADFAFQSRDVCTTVTLAAECIEEIGEETPLSAEELRQIQLDNTLGDETTND